MTDRGRETLGYVGGLVLALTLSTLAFAIVSGHVVENRSLVLQIVFGLGLLQAIVHFRFFLHIGLKRSSRDDLLLILFSVLILALMAGGTIVLMLNLRDRMM